MKKFKSNIQKGMAKGTEVFAKSVDPLILKRTAKGKGVNRPFKKYTTKYAEKHGNNVDLNVTGKMLGAMKVIKNNKKSYTVGFSNKKEENKAGHVGKLRPFMGLNKKEGKDLFKKFGNTFKRYV
jgi:hypothetical protein